MEQQNEIYAYIGSRLRFFREQAGLNQREVADMLFVSTAQYQEYEAGSNKCPVDSIMALCRRYEIALEAVVPIDTEMLEPLDWKEGGADPTEPSGENPPDVARLLTAFQGVSDPKLRLRIIALIEAMKS